jgi:hypothetical protein
MSCMDAYDRYSSTKEGSELLATVTSAVGDNAGEWLDVISKFANQSIDAGTAAVSDGKIVADAGVTATAAGEALTSDADVAVCYHT